MQVRTAMRTAVLVRQRTQPCTIVRDERSSMTKKRREHHDHYDVSAMTFVPMFHVLVKQSML